MAKGVNTPWQYFDTGNKYSLLDLQQLVAMFVDVNIVSGYLFLDVSLCLINSFIHSFIIIIIIIIFDLRS